MRFRSACAMISRVNSDWCGCRFPRAMVQKRSEGGTLTRSAALFLAFLVALPAVAQQQLPPSGETIDVSLVNVDVFVTDRNGQRVTGLTADDFEIRENGRVQPITNFAEYTSQASTTASTAPNAKRTVVVFVERFSLPEFRTRPLFASIRKMLQSVIRPGDSAAVVFWDNGGAYTLQYFTDHLPSLEAAVTEIERQSSGVRGRSEEHTSELQSQSNLVCRLLLEKKKKNQHKRHTYTA